MIYALIISYILVFIVGCLTLKRVIQHRRFIKEYKSKVEKEMNNIRFNFVKLREHIQKRTTSHTTEATK